MKQIIFVAILIQVFGSDGQFVNCPFGWTLIPDYGCIHQRLDVLELSWSASQDFCNLQDGSLVQYKPNSQIE